MSTSKNDQVVAESNSDVNLSKEEGGFQEAVPLTTFEYNLNTNVNHTFFSNIINLGTAEEETVLREGHVQWFAQNYVVDASTKYDLIPALEFGPGPNATKEDGTEYTVAEREQIRFNEKNQTLAWVAAPRNETDGIETDIERDTRAGTALSLVLQNTMAPHVRTAEFVGVVKDKVLTNVWFGTEGSIFSDTSVQTLLTSKTDGVATTDGKVFFTVEQCTEIMRQFRRLGRVKNYTFDKDSQDFTTTGDVEVSWITFGLVDSIGLPTTFTAVQPDVDLSNDITYQGKTFVAGAVRFALKFVVTQDKIRGESEPTNSTLISPFENISWLFKPNANSIPGSTTNTGFQG